MNDLGEKNEAVDLLEQKRRSLEYAGCTLALAVLIVCVLAVVLGVVRATQKSDDDQTLATRYAGQVAGEPSGDVRWLEAEVVRVIDGDTVVLNFELGLGIELREESCRLLGVNAPERRGSTRSAGERSAKWMEQRLPVGERVRCVVPDDARDKYGRVLVTVWDEEGNVNEALVEQGLAVRMYGEPRMYGETDVVEEE